MKVRAEGETNNFTLFRLLLSLAVVLGHFKLLSGTAYPHFPSNLADAAVDCFFVVSGYLIALSYARTRGLWSFYVRRFFRLYPMYACIVLIQTGIMLALLPGGPFSELRETIRYLAVNLAFANFLQYDIGGVLHGLHVPGINPSLWTLKIELGFYLIVPLIFLAIRRWGFKALVAIFIASAAYQAFALYVGDPRFAKQLPGQLQFFVVGMALYLYVPNFRVPAWVSAIVTVGFLAAWTWLDPLQPGLCPLLVGAFVFCFTLCTPVVHMRTDMSYSVYLVHGPLLQTLLLLGLFHDTPLYMAGVVAAVLALSFVAEHLVERPGNEFGRRLSIRLAPRRPVAVAAAE
ncbi:MAG TPA: acyltransferase [Acetobacteraceae bacterium]|jgi:peptidoglycan/LPS O-acetylase OafA/YrhL|nr:acyltransferase [Acetobacteraceae bacterium]